MQPADTLAIGELADRAVPHRRAFAGAVIATYTAIGVFAFWPVLPGTAGRLFGSETPDPGLMAWFIEWVAHALAHGQNPFFSHAMLVPSGVNLAENTSIPLLGALIAPLTLVLGPVTSANVLMVLAMPLSATAAFVVLQKWHVWGPAAALGGLIYGFSPYMIGQGLGHISLVFLPLPPFIALILVSIMNKSGSPIRLGIYLGLLAAAQFLISPEILATVAIFAAVALLWAGIRHSMHLLDIAHVLVVPIGVAFVVGSALVAYPVWMMIWGAQHFAGPPQQIGNPYYNDLLSFVVPGPLQRADLGMRALGTRLIGMSNSAESGGYIGVPLLLIAACFALRSRRTYRMQLTVPVLCAAGLLSLGPYLAIDGHLTHIPLPGFIFTKLPELSSIVPVRMSFEVDACIAAVVAFGLDDLRRAGTYTARRLPTEWSTAGIACLLVTVILVVTQLPEWPYASQPTPIVPVQVRQVVPPGDPLAITYPYPGPFNSEAMVWRAEDSFAFRLLGGYALHRGLDGGASLWPSRMSPSGLQSFLAAEGWPLDPFGTPPRLNSQLVATTRKVVEEYDVDLVLVDRSVTNSAAVIALFSRALGPPQLSVGNLVAWASRKGPL